MGAPGLGRRRDTDTNPDGHPSPGDLDLRLGLRAHPSEEGATSMGGGALARRRTSVVRRVLRLAAYVVMPTFTVGAIVIARRPTEVLLVRKRTGAGEWSFPAGYLWYGEELPAVAGRELTEETSVVAAVGAADLVAAYRQPWCAHLDHVFLVRADGEPRVRDRVEIVDARWWPVDGLPPLSREAHLALRHVPDALTRPAPGRR